MSPLAARLAKLLIDPKNLKRHPFFGPNADRLRKSLDDIHCFEVTEALPLLKEINATIIAKFGLAERIEDVKPEQSEFLGQFMFLPAPRTWIEYRHAVGRVGLLLCQDIIGKTATVNVFTEQGAALIGSISLVSDDYLRMGGPIGFPEDLFKFCKEHVHDDGKIIDMFLSMAHRTLMLINSPQIIGRRQVMANAGLERRITKALGAGKFPLHAWTEILLHVAKPTDIDDGEPHEAHLTGRRALHFCRKHIRIRNGRLEYVRAHWRGDPAIGIKRSRYVVAA